MLNKKNIFFLSILIISAGALLRFYQINFENYWYDEINDFWIADPNISLDATFARRERIGDVSPYFWESILKIIWQKGQGKKEFLLETLTWTPNG